MIMHIGPLCIEWAWRDHAEAVFVQLKISDHLRLLLVIFLLLSLLPFPVVSWAQSAVPHESNGKVF